MSAKIVWSFLLLAVLLFGERNLFAGDWKELAVVSSKDQSTQPSRIRLPDSTPPPRGFPLVVVLHSWSSDYKQDSPELEKLFLDKGWAILMPNFRGPNQNPAACASELAIQDVLDAIEMARREFTINKEITFLSGVSGGGHMAMMMAATYPDKWTAVSAWVGISDLKAWHEFQSNSGGRYASMIEKVCEGKPGDSKQVDRVYRERSPIHILKSAREVPIDIAAGIKDGFEGSVPIAHSILAFNQIAAANGDQQVTPEEIQQLSKPDGRLAKPTAPDQIEDEIFARAIYLRRTSCKSRLTIFEGGHEQLPKPTVAWFEKHLIRDQEETPRQ